MDWNWQPSVLIGIALLVSAYLAAIIPLRSRFQNARPVKNAQIVSFLLGVLVIFIALVSPIDEIGDRYLFSVHMTQHLMMVLVMPPLVLLGTPDWLLRPLLNKSWLARLGRFLTSFIPAFLLFNFVFTAYHVPALYDWTLRDDNVHIIVHILLMITAMITWWPILSPLPELPRLSYPLQVMYLFVQAIPPTIVAALITLSTDVLYPTYAAAPRVFGVSALEDQQTAGLVMWIPGTFVYLLALTIVFFKWFGGTESVEQGQFS